MKLRLASVIAPLLLAAGAQALFIYPVDAGGRVPSEANQTRSTAWAEFTFTVTFGPTKITDVNLNLDMVHSWDEDLEIRLRHPDGTEVVLFNRQAGGPPRFDNFDNTYFDDEAANPITGASAPYAGPFRPANPLSAFDGKSSIGTWRLRIFDHNFGDYGWLYAEGDGTFEGFRGEMGGTYLRIGLGSLPWPHIAGVP